MNREAPGKCPICDHDLKITKLHCSNCNTSLEGRFEPCKFCRLSTAQKYFLLVFVKNRGNIKEIEKELDISYPTVRNKLEDLINSLGFSAISYDNNRKEILDSLGEGKISVEEALKQLK